MKSAIALTTLVVASLALAAPAFAQSAPAATDGAQIGLSLGSPTAPPAAGPGNGIDLGLGADDGAGPMGVKFNVPGRAMGGGALMMLACSPRGTEALDTLLLHLSYKLDVTADQKPLFDTFREKALTTETSFADTCKSDMAPATAGTPPDFLTRLKARLTIDQARLTALNDVLPSFEALYNSLTDAQKAALLPDRGPGMGMGDHPFGQRWMRQDGAGRG